MGGLREVECEMYTGGYVRWNAKWKMGGLRVIYVWGKWEVTCGGMRNGKWGFTGNINGR